MKKQGLEIIIGPMMSGKTTSLLYKLNTLHNIGLNILYINHSIDNRNDKCFSSHSEHIQKNNYLFEQIKIRSFKQIDSLLKHTLSHYDVIGIDEAQFYDQDILDFVSYVVDDLKKYVIIAGLNGSFERKPFGHILQLIPLADSIINLHSYCKLCIDNHVISPGLFTHRLSNDTSLISVGDAHDYIPLCRKCYNELNKN